MGPAMCGRGIVTRRIFRQLFDVLTAGEVDKSPSWVGPSKEGIVDELPATAPPKGARRRRPAWFKKQAATTSVSMPPSATSSGREAAGQDESGLAKKETTIGRPGVNAAATVSQQASIPREHEVSLLCKGRSYPNGKEDVPSKGSTAPLAWRHEKK